MGTGPERPNTGRGASEVGVTTPDDELVTDCATACSAPAVIVSTAAVTGEIAIVDGQLTLHEDGTVLAVLLDSEPARRLCHCIELGYAYAGSLRATEDEVVYVDARRA